MRRHPRQKEHENLYVGGGYRFRRGIRLFFGLFLIGGTEFFLIWSVWLSPVFVYHMSTLESIISYISIWLSSERFERMSNSRGKKLYRLLISFLLSCVCGFHVSILSIRVQGKDRCVR